MMITAYICVCLLAFTIRLLPVLRTDFPINDGGMFFVMVQDIFDAGFRLPLTTTYNFSEIPFTYPPLAFFLAAVLSRIVSIPSIIHWLPFAFAVATVPAFYDLAKALLKNEKAALLSLLVYSLVTPTYANLLWGGGLTRAPGTFFSLLTLAQVVRLYSSGAKKHLLLAWVFGALTVLSHPVSAWFTVYSAGLFFLLNGRNRRGLGNSLLVALGVIALTAPWWIQLLSRFELQPLLAAFQSRSNISTIESLFFLWTFNFTGEKFLPILGVFGFIGFFTALFHRQWLLPAWLVLIFLLERRTPVTLAAIPFALLAGWALWNVLLPAGRSIIHRDSSAPASRYEKVFSLAAASFLGIYLLLSNLLGFSAPVLSAEQREAMAWVDANTTPGSRFLVINPTNWWEDPVSEWFPTLARRSSLATVQGSEWLSGQAFAMREDQYAALQRCASAPDVSCLEEWAQETGADFTHLFVVCPQPEPDLARTGPRAALATALVGSPHYRLIYDQPGVLVFERRPDAAQ